MVGAARAGELIVVSDGAAFGYARGTVLESGGSVTVPAGQHLALIGETGAGLTIDGPFAGKLPEVPVAASPEQSVIGAMKRIISQSSQQEVGIVRAAGIADQDPPDPHYVIIADNSTQCVAPGRPAEFWRPPPAHRTALFVTNLTNGKRSEVDWPSDSASLPWPASIAVTDGEHYEVATQGTMVKARMTIRVVPWDAPTLDAARQLAALGCGRQALAVLQAMGAASGH